MAKLLFQGKFTPIFFVLFIAFSVRFFLYIDDALNLPAPLFTPDPHYHTRRVQLLVNNYPNLPIFDYYIAYPTGGYCIWPPLFDFLAGTIAYVIFWGKPSLKQIEWVCAVYPILYGLAVVVITYLIGIRIFNKTIAFFSSLIVSILPGTMYWSRLGYNDHHIAESMILLLILYFLMSHPEKEIKKWISLGITFGLGMLIWQGSILFIGITFLMLLFLKEFSSSVSFIMAFLIISPFSVNTHFPDSPFSYRGLSLLQLCLLLGAGYVMMIGLLRKKLQWKTWFLLLPMVIIFAFLFFGKKINWGGFFFLIKNDPWLKTIIEFQPLIVQSGYIETLSANRLFSRAYYLWPLMALLLIWENRKKEYFIFLIFLTFTGIMSFLARRYAVWFTPLFAITLSYTFYRIYNFLIAHIRYRRLSYVIFGILIFTVFQPLMGRQYHGGTGALTQDEKDSYIWLNDSTPPTSHFFSPSRKPEYGIMCFWGDGHQILYHARRPVTACNFGNDVPNFAIVNKFFLEDSEEKVNAILDRLNCGYVYLRNPITLLRYSATYLNINPIEFLNFYLTKDRSGLVSTIMAPNERGFTTTIARLFYFNGSGFYIKDKFFPPYRHYRLRFISPQGSIKIFEYVKGATIKGKFEPYAPIKIFYNASISQSDFSYFDSLSTDSTGWFMFTVPYPTQVDNFYTLNISGKNFKFSVNEGNIKNGDTIYIKKEVSHEKGFYIN